MIEVPSEVQMLAWRSFLECRSAVIKALESELMEDPGLSLTWYDVLIHLSEASESRLQHQALAGSLLLSRSGVTRLVDRMAKAGLVRREASPEDRRASYVVMTPQGRDALDRASPVHVRGIVQHFTRYLDSEDASALQKFFSRVSQGDQKRDVRLETKTRSTQRDIRGCP